MVLSFGNSKQIFFIAFEIYFMLHELYKKPEASFEASDHYHTNTNSLRVYNLAAQINRPATRNSRRASKNIDSAFAFIIEFDQVLLFIFFLTLCVWVKYCWSWRRSSLNNLFFLLLEVKFLRLHENAFSELHCIEEYFQVKSWKFSFRLKIISPESSILFWKTHYVVNTFSAIWLVLLLLYHITYFHLLVFPFQDQTLLAKTFAHYKNPWHPD